eukprot:GHVO01001305.1.p1 GENE.GHVO01001305.1~~GHVO01001305.1.p1  ORF type:complete len:110 (+),score=17.90 GHVO01001305.1:918-1247(+)
MIDECASLAEVHQQWPFLFCQQWLFLHFELRTGFDLPLKMEAAFREIGPRVSSFMRSIKKPTSTLADLQSVESSPSIIIRLLQSYFKEDEESIFIIKDVMLIINHWLKC